MHITPFPAALTLSAMLGFSSAVLAIGLPKLPGSGGDEIVTSTLTVTDLEPGFAGKPIGDVEFPGVEYQQIGEAEYDEFFHSSAKIHGLIVFGKQLVDSGIASLRKLAQSDAASKELRESLGALTDTPPEQWGEGERTASEAMKAEQNAIDAEERRHLGDTAAALGLAAGALGRSVETTQDLIQQGTQLQANVSSLGTKARPAAAALKTSLGNVKDAAQGGPKLIEEIAVLAAAFRALSGDDQDVASADADGVD